MHYIVYSIQYTIYSIQYIVYYIHYTVLGIQYSPYNIHYSKQSVVEKSGKMGKYGVKRNVENNLITFHFYMMHIPKALVELVCCQSYCSMTYLFLKNYHHGAIGFWSNIDLPKNYSGNAKNLNKCCIFALEFRSLLHKIKKSI